MNKVLKTIPLLAILLLSACKNDVVIDGIPVEEDEKYVVCRAKAKGHHEKKQCQTIFAPYQAIIEKQEKINKCLYYPHVDEKAECDSLLANKPRDRVQERRKMVKCMQAELFMNIKSPGCDEIKTKFRTP